MSQYYRQNGAYYEGSGNIVTDSGTLDRLRSGQLSSSVGNFFGGGSSGAPSYAGSGSLGGPRDVGSYQRSLDASAAAANSYDSIRNEANGYAAQQRQSRIDAINTTFAPRVQREQVAGENRLSKVAALNFKSGTIGSGVDTAKSSEQKTLNDAALKSIEDEKATAINEAFTWADQLSRQTAQDKFTMAQTGAAASVAAEKNKYDTAVKSLEFFGKGGTSLEQLKTADPDTYNNLRSVGGLTDLQIASIMNANSPAPQNVDTRVENGYLISSYFDPQTKKFVHYQDKLDIPTGLDAKNIEVLVGKDGYTRAYDKQNNKVISTFWTGMDTSSGGAAGQSAQYKADVSSALGVLNKQIDQPGVLGADRKLSPDNYKKIRQSWLKAGLLLPDFEQNFNQYIDYGHAGDYYSAPIKTPVDQFTVNMNNGL